MNSLATPRSSNVGVLRFVVDPLTTARAVICQRAQHAAGTSRGQVAAVLVDATADGASPSHNHAAACNEFLTPPKRVIPLKGKFEFARHDISARPRHKLGMDWLQGRRPPTPVRPTRGSSRHGLRRLDTWFSESSPVTCELRPLSVWQDTVSARLTQRCA